MTNSAEQDLEATIWAAMTAHKVTTKEPLEFIETIKFAAMAYAAGDSDALTETRRMILHEATRPERIDHPVVAGGGGQPPRRELDPSGSRARPPVGATLSTGHVVPEFRQGRSNFHPQAVDNASPEQAARLPHRKDDTPMSSATDLPAQDWWMWCVIWGHIWWKGCCATCGAAEPKASSIDAH